MLNYTSLVNTNTFVVILIEIIPNKDLGTAVQRYMGCDFVRLCVYIRWYIYIRNNTAMQDAIQFIRSN